MISTSTSGTEKARRIEDNYVAWKRRYEEHLGGRRFHDLMAVVRGIWSANGLGAWAQYREKRQKIIEREVMKRLRDDAWVRDQLEKIRRLDRVWSFNAELRVLAFRAAMQVTIEEDLENDV